MRTNRHRSLIVGPFYTCLAVALLLASAPLARAQEGDAPPPRLGVRLAPDDGPGVLIVETMFGYAAEAAGLKAGDRVIRIGKKEVADLDDFRAALAEVKRGDSADFVVIREDKEQTIPVLMSPPRADAPGSKPPTQPQLLQELLQMRESDQAPRREMSPNLSETETKRLIDQMTQTDARNRERLKQIIAEHGFPTITMVGPEGANAAFLIVQHADRDAEWQASMLPVLEELAARGEASKSNVAYLTDRVLRAQNKPQLYATQYYQEPAEDGTMQFVPPVVEDPANLNKRRMAMGLPPWEAYEAQIAQMQDREPFPAVRGPQ